MGSPDEDRFKTILDNVDAAAEQVMEAARSGERGRIRAALIYWFGVMYDAGLQRVKQIEQQALSLSQMVDRLREMNDSLQRSVNRDRRAEEPPTAPHRRPKPIREE